MIMTVASLIEALKQYPSDYQVRYTCYEDDDFKDTLVTAVLDIDRTFDDEFNHVKEVKPYVLLANNIEIDGVFHGETEE